MTGLFRVSWLGCVRSANMTPRSGTMRTSDAVTRNLSILCVQFAARPGGLRQVYLGGFLLSGLQLVPGSVVSTERFRRLGQVLRSSCSYRKSNHPMLQGFSPRYGSELTVR